MLDEGPPRMVIDSELTAWFAVKILSSPEAGPAEVTILPYPDCPSVLEPEENFIAPPSDVVLSPAINFMSAPSTELLKAFTLKPRSPAAMLTAPAACCFAF